MALARTTHPQCRAVFWSSGCLSVGGTNRIHGGRVAYNAGSQLRNRDVTAGKSRRATGRGKHSPERRRDLLGRAASVARKQRARKPGGKRQPHSFRFRRVTHPGDSRDLSSVGYPAAKLSRFPFDRFAGLPRYSGPRERCACFRTFRNAFRGTRRDGDRNAAAAFASLRPYDRGGDERRSANFRSEHHHLCGQQHHRTDFRSDRHNHGEPQRHGASFRLQHRHSRGQRHRSANFASEPHNHGRQLRCGTSFRFKCRPHCGQRHHSTNFGAEPRDHGRQPRRGTSFRFKRRRHYGQRPLSTSFGSECRRSCGYRLDPCGCAPSPGQRSGGISADDCSNALSSKARHERCAGSSRGRAGFHRFGTAASVRERSGQFILLFGASQPSPVGRGFCFRRVDTCASLWERGGGPGSGKIARNRRFSILRFPASSLVHLGRASAGNVRVYGTHRGHDRGKRNGGLASGVPGGTDATH